MLALLHAASHYSIVLMLLVFVIVFASTYWPGRRSAMERHGQIPLHDDR